MTRTGAAAERCLPHAVPSRPHPAREGGSSGVCWSASDRVGAVSSLSIRVASIALVSEILCLDAWHVGCFARRPPGHSTGFEVVS